MKASRDPDEAALIGRVRQNDDQAFSELVRRYMRRAFSVAFRILGRKEDAEDLVQETFVIVHQKIDTFDVSRPFGPWFFRILVNRGINVRKARQVRETDPLTVEPPGSEASPATQHERGEIRRRFEEAFRTLPPQRQTIVRLFELEGFSAAEIAHILEVPHGTVRWHLHEARAVLREALKDLKEET